jgi:hypothetical protein
MQGAFNHNITMDQAPDTGSILHVQNNNTASTDLVSVIQLNWSAGGNFNFKPSTGTWSIDGHFDAQNGYSSNHVPGVSASFTTADGKTATFSGGILVGLA